MKKKRWNFCARRIPGTRQLLRIMKLTTLFLFVLFSQVSAGVFSQNNGRFSLKAEKESVNSILKLIEGQTEFRFMYNANNINVDRKVNIDCNSKSIDEVLEILFEGTNVKYRSFNNNYVLFADANNLQGSTQQGKSVTGKITDSSGTPIPGVTVVVKGSNSGVITDENGSYNLNNVPSNAILIFSFVGMKTQEIAVGNRTTINVILTEDAIGIEEVVAVGYGQQKKSSVVASINTITSKEISMPTRSLANNIAGQIAGILAIQRSGEPGRDDAQFWIRGISSFAGGTSPLVLVDGVPRNMNDIGVDEIETFTVLKDASATAVYGAEGANGVVLITSKRGAVKKPTLDVRVEYSLVKPTRLPNLMDSYNSLSLYNEAIWEDKGNPTTFTKPYTDEVLEMYRSGVDPDLYPNTNFLDLLQDHTNNKRVTLNLRGGSEKVRYFVSGAYYSENGIFDSQAIDKYNANIGLNRYNIRSNIDVDITNTTVLSTDISGQYLDSSYPGAGTETIFRNLVNFAPHLFPLRFSDGTFSEFKEYNGYAGNPYNFLNESGYQKNWEANIQSKVTLSQKLDFITSGLSLRITGSFDSNYESSTKRTKSPQSYYMRLNSSGEKEYVQVNAGQPNLTDPTSAGTAGEKQIYLESSINYSRMFAEKHDVTGMILYMQKDRQLQGSGLPYKKQSLVARGTYGYDSRYLAEASFGLTGSENFAKGYRYGIFPSIGLAWYASHEDFMESTKDIISKLKFRISYGITGNDNVGGNRFPYRSTLNINSTGYNLGFVGGSGGGGTNSPGNGIIEGTFSAPYLSWEIEEKENVGFDLGLLEGRVDMTFDFFKNKRRDILMQRKSISSVAGFRQNPFQNFGKVTNQGFDGSIVLKQNINNLKLSFRGNVTYARNKVVEYDEVDPKYEYQRYTGNRLGTPLLYIAEGLYTNDDFIVTDNIADGSKSYALKEGLPVPSGAVQPGDIKYSDLSGDGKIDSYDMTYDHQFYAPDPEWVYGFGLNAEYKGFYAGIFFQGVANATAKLGGFDLNPFNSGGIIRPLREEVVDHWSSQNPDNQNVMFPRLHATSFPHNVNESTWWCRSADFIRLKNLEFGYQFNKQMLKKVNMNNARIYVQGNNIAVWDHIKLWDPEMGSSAGSRYPISMTWTVGLELGF